MKRILVFASVAAIALIAGIAIAGLPETVADDVMLTPVPAPAAAPSTAPAPAPELAPSANLLPTASTEPTTGTAAAVASTAPATTTPSSVAPVGNVRVVVANASAIDGLATNVSAVISELGYGAVNATTAVENRPTTILYFSPGQEAAAQRLAEQLNLPATEVQPRPDGELTVGEPPNDLLLLVGSDWL